MCVHHGCLWCLCLLFFPLLDANKASSQSSAHTHTHSWLWLHRMRVCVYFPDSKVITVWFSVLSAEERSVLWKWVMKAAILTEAKRRPLCSSGCLKSVETGPSFPRNCFLWLFISKALSSLFRFSLDLLLKCSYVTGWGFSSMEQLKVVALRGIYKRGVV